MTKLNQTYKNITDYLQTKSDLRDFIGQDIINQFCSDNKLLYICILATIIFNTQIKKNYPNKYLHINYFINVIALLLINIDISENRDYYEQTYGSDKINEIASTYVIYIFTNAEKCIKHLISATGDTSIELTRTKIFELLDKNLPTLVKPINVSDCDLISTLKSDILTYNFSDKNILAKYKKQKRLKTPEYDEYIKKKYCCLCETILQCTWLMSGGKETSKNTDNILSMGNCFGHMIKIINDFTNLERDIDRQTVVLFNIIGNNGIQDSFKTHYDNKIQFIESCMKIHLMAPLLTEMLDRMDENYYACLEKSDIDLKSKYSSYKSSK